MPRRLLPQWPTGWELKLIRLEEAFGYGHNTNAVPGTTLSRVLMPESEGGGPGWCLGMGRMQDPKCLFYSRSIKGCMQRARNAATKGKTRPPEIPLSIVG